MSFNIKLIFLVPLIILTGCEGGDSKCDDKSNIDGLLNMVFSKNNFIHSPSLNNIKTLSYDESSDIYSCSATIVINALGEEYKVGDVLYDLERLEDTDTTSSEDFDVMLVSDSDDMLNKAITINEEATKLMRKNLAEGIQAIRRNK